MPDAQVTGPFDAEGSYQLAQDQRTGYINVVLPDLDSEEKAEIADELADLREYASGDDLQVEIGGVLLDQEAGAARTSSGALRVRSVHNATWESVVARFMSPHRRSRKTSKDVFAGQPPLSATTDRG